MTDDELFKILAPGECWHEWITYFANGLKCGLTCKHCGERDSSFDNWHSNPDFSTWEGFGWLRERMGKRLDWEHFFMWMSARSDIRLDDFFFPIPFRDALKEYLKGEGR